MRTRVSGHLSVRAMRLPSQVRRHHHSLPQCQAVARADLRDGLRPESFLGHAASMGARPDIRELELRQAAIYRAMSPAERLKQAVRMFRQMQSLMDAGLRTEHPAWTPEQRRRVIAQRILYARTG